MWARGTRVIAKGYRQRKLSRVVWEDLGRGILLCTVEEYQHVQREGGEPVTVGFPSEDIRPEQETNYE